jgi:hypothetical protein
MQPRRRAIILGLLLNPLCPGRHPDKAVAFLVDYLVLILVAYQRDLAHPRSYSLPWLVTPIRRLQGRLSGDYQFREDLLRRHVIDQVCFKHMTFFVVPSMEPDVFLQQEA